MNNAQQWDERYRSSEQLFSGRPNGVLVAEVSGLAPGQALDVGSGEGADALWLAGQGWRVTAVDVSRVALERAAANAGELADRVSWTHVDLAAGTMPAGSFDLVSAHYFPFARAAGESALRALLDTVAPGGTLLVVSHDLADLPPGGHAGFDPGDYYQPRDLAALLGDDWTVEADETRPRVDPAPEGTAHAHDVVLRARRDLSPA
ncbi:class I SAM-dependent methyltransferase [Prauserella sp. ASG 168]|uniref:Class I SAM-dependent methyltransferase n=2 Tax=Prauserella cavernicola TaxID=2800127 RepID=A0A934V1K7_9PSEU|nr:class I SAM-dependent methyltransferase [Prauserella cavernicola]